MDKKTNRNKDKVVINASDGSEPSREQNHKKNGSDNTDSTKKYEL